MSLDVSLNTEVITRVYEANITHNLNTMAKEAGLYEVLWRPEDIGVVYAKDIILKLNTGLILLKSDPERFKQFNPKNGWGTYENLVKFVEDYYQACLKTPHATIDICK